MGDGLCMKINVYWESAGNESAADGLVGLRSMTGFIIAAATHIINL